MPRHPKETNRYVMRVTKSMRKDGKSRFQVTPPKRLMERVADENGILSGEFTLSEDELVLTLLEVVSE